MQGLRVVDFVQLRGGLPQKPLGARGIVQALSNPSCQTLAASVLAGVPMTAIVRDTFGQDPRDGQSPFAIASGNAFEREITQEEAARLAGWYRDRGLLPSGPVRVMNVAEIADTREERHAATLELVNARLHGHAHAPDLILKGRLEIELLGGRHAVEPDYLVASPGERFYRVGEIKGYVDRGGKTDTAKVTAAVKQGAVSVVALRQETGRHGFPATVDLALRKPSTRYPLVTRMLAEGEVERLHTARLTPVDLPPGASLADPATVMSLPINYLESCKEFCPMAAICEARERAAGSLSALGDHTIATLRPAGTVARAIELSHGVGNSLDPDEAELAAGLIAARRAMERASHVGHA